jgi:hypothetical protein
MTEAIGLNPESTAAGFAQGYAAVLDRQIKDYQRFRFNAYGGFDYDSNENRGLWRSGLSTGTTKISTRK